MAFTWPQDEEHGLERAFGPDYSFVSESYLDSGRSDGDAARIARLLSLRPGMSVLDLGCGSGRIAVPLARRGLVVTGADNSPPALVRARAAAQAARVALRLSDGDMRELSFHEEFDAVVSWYTSLGYYDDAVERGILRRLFRALRPGGRLLIEHVNRDRVLRNYQTYAVEERDGHLMIDHNAFDPLAGRTAKTRTFIGPRGRRSTAYSIRLFTFPELRDWLLDAGFADVRGLAPDGGPFAQDSARMIVLATRPFGAAAEAHRPQEGTPR
jgi:2-polyprenyl-3-methyl-5-hydroxy-6-metoxy-1,4-benzoquinol methylase